MKKILIVLLLEVSFGSFAQNPQTLKLWYKQPSGNTWENALPIGNGRQAAMVYGNVSKEIFQLNEHTVWSGSPNRNDNPEALANLPEIRKLIFEGNHKEAEKLANKAIITKKSHGQMFQPVGNLNLIFEGHDNYSDYYRELDIEQAITKTSYVLNGVTYTREAFTSFADRVLVIKLSASKPGALAFNAFYSSPHKKKSFSVQNQDLQIQGTTSDQDGVKGLVEFKGIARIKLTGGAMSKTDTSLVVKNAHTAVIFVSIASNFNNYHDISGDEEARAAAYLAKAYSKSYENLKANHIKAYQKYFNRVAIHLGETEATKLPTDERLRNFRNTSDPQLVSLYYQFGRYLLISSSQPGGQAANLQGIWNNRLNPPWDSKYTININAEMNYWPAEKTNLSELHEPFLQMVKDLSVTGQQTAKDMYGARGWMAHHNTDIWRATGAIDGAFWGMWTAGGGWVSQHLWEHYLYTGDKAFLASAYPALKGAALFYVDFLIPHPNKNNWLVVNPGNSPENAPAAHDGSSLDAGVTMDNQIVFDVFNTAIKAAQILKKDAGFIDSLKILRSKLPPMHIGQHNQLQEWLDDIDDPKDTHRHISHLYGLYPSNQISAYRTPELFEASKNSLIYRGDVSTGWSMGWKVNWWAKLQDGNHAYKLIQNQLTPIGNERGAGGTYNNLFDAHPPFQIDGNFGCTSGITEMLMQSSDAAVHLLPALPDVWPSGSIAGIKARGGFEIVNMQWKEGKLVKLVLKSNLGGNLRLRLPNEMKAVYGAKLKSATGQNTNPFFSLDETPKPVISEKAHMMMPVLKETQLYDISTQKGQTITLSIKI